MPRESRSKKEPELWKDYITRNSIDALARRVRRAWRRFDVEAFVSTVYDDAFAGLELKDRITRIADGLKRFLPKDYGRAVKVLVAVGPEVRGFENWALTTFIERHGLEDFETSVEAMRVLTRYGSAEFAIRPYMLRYLDRMMPILHQWTQDDNEHVRRLAAEGTRPRGVWMPHIPAFREDPRPVIDLLEKLNADESLYVRKAVANNLNDISKDHPDIAISTARRWHRTGRVHTQWIVKHGCRTLIKQGHPEVFAIFGFTDRPKVTAADFRPSRKTAAVGETLGLTCRIESAGKTKQKLAIDFTVHYVKKNGKTSPKVFKWAEKTIGAGESLELSTEISLREMTTRTHYPGRHPIELVVNGRTVAETSFTLRA